MSNAIISHDQRYVVRSFGPINLIFCVLHLPNEDLTVSPTFAIFSVIYFKILSLKEHLFSIVMILLYLL